MSTPGTGLSSLETVRERLRRLGAAAQAANQVAADRTEARNVAILEAGDAGLTVREIAALVDVSRPRVHQVLVRMSALRQAGARLRSELR